MSALVRMLHLLTDGAGSTVFQRPNGLTQEVEHSENDQGNDSADARDVLGGEDAVPDIIGDAETRAEGHEELE